MEDRVCHPMLKMLGRDKRKLPVALGRIQGLSMCAPPKPLALAPLQQELGNLGLTGPPHRVDQLGLSRLC